MFTVEAKAQLGPANMSRFSIPSILLPWYQYRESTFTVNISLTNTGIGKSF